MDFDAYVGDLCSLLNTTPDSLCAVFFTAVGTTALFAMGRLFGWAAKRTASLAWAAVSYPFRSHYGKLDVLVIEALTSDKAKFTPARRDVNQPARIDSGNVGTWLTWDGDYHPHVLVGSQDASDLLCAKAKKQIISLMRARSAAHDEEVRATRLRQLEMLAESPTKSPTAPQVIHTPTGWTVDTAHNPPVFWASNHPKPV